MELPLAVNPTGCARSEPKMSAHVKRFVLRYFVLTSHSTARGFQASQGFSVPGLSAAYKPAASGCVCAAAPARRLSLCVLSVRT